MEVNNHFEKIQKQIEKGEEISPFLFLSQNLEILHSDVEAFIMELFQAHKIDKQSLFHLSDTWEALKIDEIKRFVAQGDVRPRFAFQIFFIENISRMTLQSFNACLKFFEEPWVWNVIFLTNTSQSGVLETILSRVQEIHISNKQPLRKNDFYISMIQSHITWKSDELIRYFFSGKYEKSEYVDFLKTLLVYVGQSGNKLDMLDEIHEDITGILKNNLQWKYIVDKYIVLLSN